MLIEKGLIGCSVVDSSPVSVLDSNKTLYCDKTLVLNVCSQPLFQIWVLVKNQNIMANTADPDKPSRQDLHCLQK